MCLHAHWMPVKQCTRCTPLPKVAPVPTTKTRYGSADLRLTDEQIKWFWRHCTQHGHHLVFNGGGKRHMDVTVVRDGRLDTTLVSVARVAWVIFGRHHREPFLAKDRLVNTCGLYSQNNEGDGICVFHTRIDR